MHSPFVLGHLQAVREGICLIICFTFLNLYCSVQKPPVLNPSLIPSGS